jgi:hypothetical protein
MSRLKIVALCAVAVAIAGVVAVGTASAAPVWESCRSGAAGTKFTGNQCTEASGAGEFGWAEIKNTEAAEGTGTLRLTDNVPIIGNVSINCAGVSSGDAGPGRFGRIATISVLQCSAGENCEILEKKLVPMNLPYQGELFETEKKVEGKTTGTIEGHEPAAEVTCKVLGKSETVICEYTVGGTPEIGSFENRSIATILSVLLTALKVSKQNCTKGKGEQAGSGSIKLASGAGLRVS